MMTPKDKAIDLYNKFLNPSGDTYLYGMLEHESAKECASIAVNEMLYWFKAHSYSNKNYDAFVFYTEVKQEIELL